MLDSWRNCRCLFFFFCASESFASRYSKLRTALQLLHQNHQFKWPMAHQSQTRYMSKVWLPETVFTRIHIFSGWTFPTPDPLWATTLISRQLSAFWISVSTNAPSVSSKRFVQFKEGSFPFLFTVVVHCLVLQYAYQVSHLIPWQLVPQKLGQVSFSSHQRFNAYIQRERENKIRINYMINSYLWVS